MEKMIVINNVALEFDMLDADTAERYENALAEMENKAETLDGVAMTLAGNIRSQCHAIFDFFNAIFGEDTDKSLFGNKTNLDIAMDAYDVVIDAANAQRLQYESRLEKYYSAARAAR